MERMIRRLTRDQERLYRNACFTHKPFCYIFPAFKRIEEECDELSPFEVWIAAIDFSNRLLEMTVPTMQIEYEIDELNEERLTEHSAFLVELAALHRLAPLRKNNPKAVEIMAALMPYVMNHPLYREMMREIGDTEDEFILNGNRISLLEYELKDIDADDNAAQIEVMDTFVDVVIQSDVNNIKGMCASFSEFNDKYEQRFQPQLDRLRAAWYAKSVYRVEQHIEKVEEMNVFKDNSKQERIESPKDSKLADVMKYIAVEQSNKRLA